MILLIVAFMALFFRILLLGSERIFLRKLSQFDSIIVASLFFLGATFFLIPGILLVPYNVWFTGLDDLYLALISAIFYSFGFFLYVKALSVEDASLIAPLYNSSLLWLLLLGVFILEENVTIFRAIGAICMFIGMFFLYPGSPREKILAIQASKGSIFMIIGSIFLAVGRTIDTFAIRTINEIIYAIAINFFIGIYLLIASIGAKKIKDGILLLKKEPKFLILAGFVNGWSYLFLLIAIMGFGVTLAEPASLLSIFVTAFLAKIFLYEKIKERLLGSLVLVFGAILFFF